MLTQLRTNSLVNFLLACAMAGILAACGGGGTNDGCQNVDPSRSGALPGCGVTATPGTGTGNGTAAGTVTLAITDAGGAPFNALSPIKGGKLVATVKNNLNQPIVNALVTFKSTDTTAVFSPATGTALTNSSGVASVDLAAGTQAGAFMASASTPMGTATVTGSNNYTVTFGPNDGTAGTTMSLGLLNESGVAISNITPESTGVMQVVVKDRQNKPVPNVAITFNTTDSTAVLSPSSGTALTDANGVAKVTLASGTKAGAFIAGATGTVGTTTLTSSSAYSVSFPALALSALTFTPATLAAGGNASIRVSVTSGGAPYLPSIPVAFSSPCADANKAVIGSPVMTQNGVAVASYTDKGCGTADTVKASIATPSGTVVRFGTITVLPPAAGSLSFAGVSNSNIALVGTGGPGRVEFSSVRFRLFDENGNPLAGKQLDFTFADTAGLTRTIGGLDLKPTSAITDQDGYASTVVGNGTIPTSVRVLATTTNANNQLLTTVSSILVVSTGIPDQRHFSVRPVIGNCEGRDWIRECTQVVAHVADHFGNPVPDGTAVNFTTESGMIDASCLTANGICTVKLFSSNTKFPDGRLTVLAYAVGEETLFDNNGNNVYDPGEVFNDKSPDIFRDDSENARWDAGEPCIGPNNNSACSTAGDGVYNGVLRRPQVRSAQTLYVSDTYTQIFSGSDAQFEAPASLSCSPGRTTTAAIRVFDVARNLMPAGTSIGFTVAFAVGTGSVSPDGDAVRNVVHSIGMAAPIPTYALTITCPPAATTGMLKILVTTPLGIKTPLEIPITVN
ncbi:MAG: hypothetical protein K0R43_1274 [Pseudoduganella sp.]|jgi:hypothetical protein|nr:hypothetical protein [Pseudoduganella sp.]